MSEGNRSRSRLLPSLLGLLILLSGLALLAGGIKLASLGGSLYYLLAGIGLALSGLLLLLGKRAALGLYALVLFASTVWALWEVGLDWWQLVPRLALWFVFGLLLWLPWFRRPLLADGPAPLGTAALGVAVVLAGAAAVGSQFTNPGQIVGRIDRDSGMTSTAPAMPDGDWQAYGRTEFGDRYSPLKQITPANVGQLEEAWRIRTGDLPTADDPLELTNENTPLKVNGMLYACTAHSKVLALDPDTGAEIWRFDPQIQSPVGFKGFAHMTCRGVSYYDEEQYARSDVRQVGAVDQALAAFIEHLDGNPVVATALLQQALGRVAALFFVEGGPLLGEILQARMAGDDPGVLVQRTTQQDGQPGDQQQGQPEGGEDSPEE